MFCGDFTAGLMPGARVFLVYGLLFVVTARLAAAVLRMPASP